MLGGCSASAGNCFDQAFLQKNLIKGKTTPAQVERLCGSPKRASQGSNGPSTYVYSHSNRPGNNPLFGRVVDAIPGLQQVVSASDVYDGAAAATGASRKNLMVIFHKGTVSSYTLSSDSN
ncbi:hypothetical protein ACWA50_10905 [Testudinibacter sp. P17/SS/0325]|uniref:hypothetical protein n=1 Tax=Testudinibacter sp. TW-1 TaxID=3417757 RepID=UPI003D35DB6B